MNFASGTEGSPHATRPMLKTISDFFSKMIAPGLAAPGLQPEQALQVATAALLLEMMRQDQDNKGVEAETVVHALRQQFGLDAESLRTLLDLAEQEAREATGYHQFTSLINRTCTAEQKVRIVEYMWQVAYADGHLDAHEAHLMRKIADLLHVAHADYIAAKQRGRDAAARAATSSGGT